MITIDSIKKTVLLAGGLFLSVLSANADDVQEKLDFNYLRSPEAAAFMKYGEESVNEYTGTANISVPLYTIKCKDIEIPLVLNYNASGIKVEQEESWVGLGWDLTIGGCINYVCAGEKDEEVGPQAIDDASWTQYLGTVKYPNSNVKNQYYKYKYNDPSNYDWMSRVPYQEAFTEPYTEDINDGSGIYQYYLFRGYGERDFYSVNVLGKTFMFFLDPFTLNTYPIGQAGEEFKVETCRGEESYVLEKKGNGRKDFIYDWKITDSNGYIYYFTNGDKLDEPKSGMKYTSCWYLSKIYSPLGEKVDFSYTKPHEKMSRPRNVESLRIPIVYSREYTSKITEDDLGKGENQSSQSTKVYYHYLTAIKTANQTVTFETSRDQNCSGKEWDILKLDAIKIASTNTNSVMKTIKFSYSYFKHDNKGGNYTKENNEKYSDNRLKLDNVKEIASGETLTTCFSYNEEVNLPSKRSCAQDYWGYYNGQENKKGQSGNTLIPAPQEFMSLNYNPELGKYSIDYADRYSRTRYMQAAMLNKVVYPTGGYTTYEYEPNSITTTDFTQTEKYRDKKYDEYYNMSFSWDKDHGANNDIHHTVTFELKEETTFDVYVRTQGDLIKGTDMKIMLIKWGSSESYIPITCTCSGNFDLIDKKELKVLSAGKYTLRIIPPDAKGPSNGSIGWGITCQLKGWHKSTLSQSNYTLTCGGLRIRKICNFDNDNSLIDSIAYNYNDYKGSSTGVLLDNIETIETQHCVYNLKEIIHLQSADIAHLYVTGADVYTITPGRTRFPEFYASCNPGIVGYSQVTKRKYDKNGNIEKYIITNYINNAPSNGKVRVLDYYKDFSNGKVICQDILDADSSLILRTNNTYDIKLANHYAINIGYSEEKQIYNGEGYGGYSENIMDIKCWRYPYILSRVELAKATTTEYCPDGKTIVRMKDYSYNPKNHQVSLIDENTSLSNQIQRTRIKYSVDDDKCKVMVNSYHRLNDVVETKKILVENGKENCVSTQRTAYNGSLPISSSTSVGNAPLEIRAKYTYDNGCNVSSVTIDGQETIYIWSYNGQYPIAKIEGIKFDDLKMALFNPETSPVSLDNAAPQYRDNMKKDLGLIEIDKMTRETETNKINAFISTIREKVNGLGGLVTTYTYKPLIGMESQTLPNGMKTTYEYDGFGRLTKVLDHNNKAVSTNSYNYKK